jgi:hypothetical protein
MVRDFTKSAISLSWALSLLGVKQTLNLFRPGQRGINESLSSIAQATADQLDGSVQGIYRVGDNLQARIVDIAFASFNPANWVNPAQWAQATSASDRRPPNGTQTRGLQAPYSGTWLPSSSPARPPCSPQESQSSGQLSSQSPLQASAVSSAPFWFNPLNWLNRSRWPGGRSGGSGGCGQKTCGCGQITGAVKEAVGLMEQMARPTENSSADTSSSVGTASWGPMPCRDQSAG